MTTSALCRIAASLDSCLCLFSKYPLSLLETHIIIGGSTQALHDDYPSIHLEII